MIIKEHNLISIPCICCNKDVRCEEFRDNTRPEIAYGGIICNSNGNYGSAQLDYESLVTFLICDKCFEEKNSKMIFNRIPNNVHKKETRNGS